MTTQRSIVMLFLCILLIALSACNSQPQREQPESAFITVDLVRQFDGVLPQRTPLHVHDRHPLVIYTAHGEREQQIYGDVIFPTDVIVVFTNEMQQPRVFLARSPHGGCLVTHQLDPQYLIDPCYGSTFTLDGRYVRGPAPRSLGELPAELHDAMIHVQNTIIYGKRNP